MSKDPREYSLLDILALKHYPQVLRVSRPYYSNGREYLKRGQYITVVDRKKVELIAGVDQERRFFQIRKDRSIHVEDVEDERVVRSLGIVVECVATNKHINAIEFRKEIRHEKVTFGVGEKFTIEKISKSFRGRTKNVALRRKKDGKIYRFPLDLIGSFKLLPGKMILPLSRILSLRPLPITVRFLNSPTSTNFPTGIVELQEAMLCDVVYILTVSKGLYTYEALSIDSNIVVEKCNLLIPKPILRVIPNGMFVNSTDFVHPIKGTYKRKMENIDSNLYEDIFAHIYYGSASFEKNAEDDNHLTIMSEHLSSDKSHEELQHSTQQSSESIHLTNKDKEQPPAPLPRYSKKIKYRNTISFPAIQEHERFPALEKAFEVSPVARSAPKTTMDCGTSMDDTIGRSIGAEYQKQFSFQSGLPGSLSGSTSGSLRSINSSVRSTRSSSSDRQGIAENAARLFYNPHNDSDTHPRDQSQFYDGPTALRRHSRTSSNATIDSFDSGVALTNAFNSAASSALNSPTVEENPLYSSTHKHHGSSNVRRITLPPPVPPRDPIYRNIVQVDIDIGDTASNIYNDVRTESPYEHLPGDQLDSSFDFRSHSLHEVGAPAGEVRNRVSETRPPMLTELPLAPTNQFPTLQLEESPPYFHARSNSMDIVHMTQEDVGNLLARLNLSNYIPIFYKELINGQLLQELEERTLVIDLGMTHFQARKLFKYVHGWRPILRDINDNELIVVPSNPLFWSVSNVFTELQMINLQQLAFFCKDHQIDGSLLKDLIENKIIFSLKDEHGVPLSGIELSRLKAFILNKWKPDRVHTGNTNTSFQSGTSFDKKDKSEKKYKPLWNRLIAQATGLS